MDYFNYEDYNDYELLAYICENNEEACDIIFRKYEPLIVSTAKKYYVFCKNVGLQLNDLIQEGMLALDKAINNFDEQKNILFYTFAKICIERSIIAFVTRKTRNKKKPLNNCISLDLLAENGGEFKILCNPNLTPEELVTNKEYDYYLCNKINQQLTPMERKVFDLKKKGYSYTEMSKILNKSMKSIDGTLHRARCKIKNILNEADYENIDS